MKTNKFISLLVLSLVSLSGCSSTSTSQEPTSSVSGKTESTTVSDTVSDQASESVSTSPSAEAPRIYSASISGYLKKFNSFTVGEELLIGDSQITLYYTDKTTEVMDITADMISSLTTETSGYKTMKITAKDYIAELTYQVLDNSTGLEYTLNDDNASYAVTGYGSFSSDSFVLPETYEGLPITDINLGFKSYFGNTVKKIIIPGTVRNIESYSFSGFNFVEMLRIKPGIENLTSGAFSSCSSLKNISLPDTIIEISPDNFTSSSYANDTSSWTEEGLLYLDSILLAVRNSYNVEPTDPDTLTIKEGTTVIAQQAFFDNKQFHTINFPSTITSFSEGSFRGSNIYEISLPETLTHLGNQVFSGCQYLEKVTLPTSLEVIPDNSFSSCTVLKEINLASLTGLRKIEDSAFSNCIALRSVEIPENVTSLGARSFEGDLNICHLTLPSTLTEIGYYAFNSCTKLTEVYNKSSLSFDTTADDSGIYDLHPYIYTEENGSILYTDDGFTFAITESGAKLIDYIGDKEYVIIPETITINNQKITVNDCGQYVFYMVNTLVGYVLPNTITHVDGSLTYNCQKFQYFFFHGTDEEFLAIKNFFGSFPSNRYIYSEEEPTQSGSYWHYVDGVPTVW